MLSNKIDKKESRGVVCILTGFGLGDLFNFGFYILPGILEKYKYVHIITNQEENIFRYELGVIWHFYVHDQVDISLESVLKEKANKIAEVMYLDSHIATIVSLKKITAKYDVKLVYPSRTFIDRTIRTEKGFYFNIYIKMVESFGLGKPRINKPVRLFDKKEELAYNEYCVKNNVSLSGANIMFAPESMKKIKSLSPASLQKMIEWFKRASPGCNVFIISRNPKYLLPGAYHINSSTVCEVCYFINKANIFVSVDTGFIHVANFLKKDIMGLFGPTCSKRSLYSQKGVLEVTNIVQPVRCLSCDKNVYLNPCVRMDKCTHPGK